MRRRELIALLGGAAAWPLGARAQRGDRVRRIGVVSPGGPSITWMREGLRQGLNELGYVEGENLRIDFRWAHGRLSGCPPLSRNCLT